MKLGVVYVNGQYLPRRAAAIPAEDRGALFADGVYEVVLVHHGKLIDYDAHITRLKRSLKEIRMEMPVSDATLHVIVRELLRRNHVQGGDVMLYIHLSRGAAKRNHLFPKHAAPTLVMTVSKLPVPSAAEREKGVSVVTHDDLRWARKDIKSIALLPNVLARQYAADKGAREAWLVDARGVVTEASTSNAYIVDGSGAIRTHPADTHILCGVTRNTVLSLARAAKMKIIEKPFTPAEAAKAKEAFITSTTAGVLPVSSIDGKKIPVGPITKKLMSLYDAYLHKA